MNKNLYITMLISVLIISTLACGFQLPPEPTTADIAPVALEVTTSYEIVTVTGNVYIRYEGEVTGVAEKGTRLVGNVDGNVFRLSSGETVWLGCTDVESDYGCQSQ